MIKCDNKWDSVTKQLDSLRYALKDYVTTIHKRYPNGFTPYQAFSFLIAHGDKIAGIPRLNFEVKKLSEEDIQNIRDCANEIEQNSQKFSAEHWKMLGYINKSSWTPIWRDDVQHSCAKVISVIDELLVKEKSFEEMLEIHVADELENVFLSIVELADDIKNAVRLPKGLYSDDWEQVNPVLQKFVADVSKRKAVLDKLISWNFEQLREKFR